MTRDVVVRSLMTTEMMVQRAGWSFRAAASGWRGRSARLDAFVLSLDADCFPHDLHEHAHHEVMLNLSGALVWRTPGRARTLPPGSVVFAPGGCRHASGAGPEPVSLLVLQWKTDAAAAGGDDLPPPVPVVAEPGPAMAVMTAAGWTVRVERVRLFEGERRDFGEAEDDQVIVLRTGRLLGFPPVGPAPALIACPAGAPLCLIGGPGGCELVVMRLGAPEPTERCA